MDILNRVSGFIRSMLSESDGSVSTTRVCIAMIFSYIIGTGITLVLKIHTPITPADVNAFLASAGTFIVTTCTPLYAINKGADVINNSTDSKKQ